MQKQLGAVALVVALVGGAIVGCSGDGSTDLTPGEDGGPAPSPTVTPTTTATTEPPGPMPDAGEEEDGGEDAGADADAGPPPPPVYGLDSRPANTTCKAPSRPPTSSPVQLDRVYANLFAGANGIQHPMIMAEHAGRWYLAQRDGRVVSFKTDGTDMKNVMTKAQLLTLSKKSVMDVNEGGFHGLVFDPKFDGNGNRRVYVAFSTTADAGMRDPFGGHPATNFKYAEEIGYFDLKDDGTFDNYKRLLHIGRWYEEHFGGSVLFGNDGYLYISSGDGTDDSLAPWTQAGNFYGKVLRIDPYTAANGKSYAIPPTNPFAGDATKEQTVWSWGLRNPFQMTVDGPTGDIFLGDVGNDAVEEIDRVVRGGHFGWPCYEGNRVSNWAINDPYKCVAGTVYTAPLHAYPHVAGGNAAIGGYVYRGSALPALQGVYVFADYVTQKLSTLTQNGASWTAADLVTGNQNYSAFAKDASNELYVLAVGYGGDMGSISKIVPRANQAPSTFPAFLSQTGCVDAVDPTKPAPGVIAYDLNAPLYSDNATKERFFAIPDGTTIARKTDGDFDFPIGSVLVKTFAIEGKRIETRLMVRHTDGDWGGYSYEWNTQGTDAVLLPAAGKSKTVGSQTWTYPSRTDCFRCHTEGAGRSLGLEAGQLNRDLHYAATGKTANQLVTLDHVGFFTAPLGELSAQPAFPPPFEGVATEAKARAYLHANCSGCHRSNGAAGRASIDLLYATPLASTKTCNVAPNLTGVGTASSRLVKPGAADDSVLWLRMHTNDVATRMPQLGRSLEDTKATALVKAWIDGLQGCPQ